MSPTLKIILIDQKFPDYYDLLDVAREASERDVILAYRKLALNQHPDKAGGGHKQNETFSHINNAREVLTDSEKRRQYNAQLLKHEVAIQRSKRQGQKPKATPKPVHTPAQPAPRPAPRHQQPKPQTPRRVPDPTEEQPYYSHPSYNPVRSHIAFNRFFPPVSGHPSVSIWGELGTKPPPDSAWAQYIWRGMATGKMHEAACQYAILVCDSAKNIQSMVVSIERGAALNLNRPPVIADPKNFRKRLGAGIELCVELLHFVAESYHYHKDHLDLTVDVPMALAAPLIHGHGFVFERLRDIMTNTGHRLSKIYNLVRDSKQSVDPVFKELIAIFEDWKDFCEIPSNILTGVDDTFFVETAQWRNNWVRKRLGGYQFGYRSNPFLLRGGQHTTPHASNPQASAQSHQQPDHDTSQQPKRHWTQAPHQDPKHKSNWEHQHRTNQQQPGQQPKQPPDGYCCHQQGFQNRNANTTGFSGFAWRSNDWRNNMPPESRKAGSNKDEWFDEADLIE